MKNQIAIRLALSLMACGGGPIARENLNAEVVKALCANYAKCGLTKSETGCLDLLQPLFNSTSTTGTTAALITAGKVKYDGNKARQCVDSYASLSCTSPDTSGSDACSSIYEGQVALGAGCFSNECVPGAWCSPVATGTCPGTCKMQVAVGGSASSSGECQKGLVIVGGKCATPGAQGATCTTTALSSCDDGLFCASDTKICTKYRVTGDSCSPTAQCGSYDSCVSAVCTKPGDVGATCGGAGGNECKLDLTCDLTKANPVCAELFAEGATCQSFNGSECKSALVCVSGQGTSALTCQKPGTVGQGCVSGSCAADLFCDSASKTCKAELAGGSACTQTDSCKDGFCSTGFCKNFTTTTTCQ